MARLIRRGDVRVVVSEKALPPWVVSAYKILDESLAQYANVEPDEHFYAILNEHFQGYVNEGRAPPAEIATAILNLADDFYAGRQMTVRSGDFIAVHNFARKAKK